MISFRSNIRWKALCSVSNYFSPVPSSLSSHVHKTALTCIYSKIFWHKASFWNTFAASCTPLNTASQYTCHVIRPPLPGLRLPCSSIPKEYRQWLNEIKRRKFSVMPATSHSKVSVFKDTSMEGWRRNVKKFCGQGL